MIVASFITMPKLAPVKMSRLLVGYNAECTPNMISNDGEEKGRMFFISNIGLINYNIPIATEYVIY
jgi:hypothetical protein